MEGMLSDRLTLCQDGQYRWSYDLKAHHNYDLFIHWLKFIVPVTTPLALVVLIGGRNAKPYGPVLFFGAFMLLLPAFLALYWRYAASRTSYRLSDTELETWPKETMVQSPYELKNLRSITCFPEKDMLLLRFTVARVRVYVCRDDYERVQDLLRERAPQGTEFFR